MNVLLNVATQTKGILLYDDSKIVDRVFWEVQGQELKYILPNIQFLLHKNHLSMENDIQNILLCTGPGSFTGIRIAVSIVNTLKYLFSHIQLRSFSVGDLYAVLDEKKSSYYFFQIFFADVFVFDQGGKFLKKMEKNEFFDSEYFHEGTGSILDQEERTFSQIKDFREMNHTEVLSLEKVSLCLPNLADPFYGKDANITVPKEKK